MAQTWIDRHEARMEKLEWTRLPLDAQEPAGTISYLLARMDALEHRVQELEEWLTEVADDMLERTRPAS